MLMSIPFVLRFPGAVLETSGRLSAGIARYATAWPGSQDDA